MSLNAYTTGLTAQEIVAQCEQTCGSPGLHLANVAGVMTEAITAPAYIQLNEILTSLYTQHEWPFLATAANVVLATRENALPVDYWRARFTDPLILLDGDSRYTLALCDPAAWFHGGLEGAETTGKPTRFTIDKSRSSFFLDCIPDRTYNGELHYYRFVARLTTIASVPMFPDSALLVQLLAAWYFQRDDDAGRWQVAKSETAEAIARIRASLTEDSDGENTLLDPRVFRTPPFDSW